MKKILHFSEEDRATIRKLDMRSWHVWAATWFGSGFMKPAPGTWGSLAALPFGLLIIAFGNLLTLIAGIIAVTAIGLISAKKFEQDTGIHDSKMIVIDEVAGQWVALIPIIMLISVQAPYFPIYIVLAFVFFRLFDILKPWPASFFDKKVDGAPGVMFDDIVAGLYAAILLYGAIAYAGPG
ncbi:MAG: phosphatidylglycerophosphatase A [Alphaproteobacteria bacterium]